MKPVQQKAAILIAQGISKKETASQCEVCPETISNWSRELVFKKALAQLQLDSLNEARDLFRNSSMMAVETLLQIIQTTDNESLKAKLCIKLLENAGIGVPIEQLSKYGFGIEKSYLS